MRRLILIYQVNICNANTMFKELVCKEEPVLIKGQRVSEENSYTAIQSIAICKMGDRHCFFNGICRDSPQFATICQDSPCDSPCDWITTALWYRPLFVEDHGKSPLLLEDMV